MKQWKCILTSLAAGIFLASQAVSAADERCDPKAVPKTIEGQAIKIEPEQGKVTIRAADGTTHEFQASKETLQDYKIGDTIKANLRSAPKCERK